MEKHSGGIEGYIRELDQMIEENKAGKNGKKGKALAVGECGLDYDRLFLAPKEAQLEIFSPQLTLATKHDLPLFLHPRNCHGDFIALLRACPSPLRGVFHSVIASLEEALEPDRPRSVDRNQRVALPKLSKTSLSSNDFHSNRSWSNLIVLGPRW
ncbi:hypothetical protein JCM5353_003607, partial [Sporobolomyces roseus]